VALDAGFEAADHGVDHGSGKIPETVAGVKPLERRPVWDRGREANPGTTLVGAGALSTEDAIFQVIAGHTRLVLAV
jgi:hypothetical protein